MSNKHDNYEILNLLGYGLAKFNNSFVEEFGVKTKTDFYNQMVEYYVANTTSTIKNRQDLFDPFFENGRKGWWQKGETYIHRKHFIDSLFGNLNCKEYANIIKIYLKDNFKYNKDTFLKVAPIVKSQFKQLQKTGLEAEMFFYNNYSDLDIFYNGHIKDVRLFGDGYDFQIEVNNNYFLAEVKGVRENNGAIRLTKKEYTKAQEYKENYILSIISNLNDVPKITLIANPIKNLTFHQKTIRQNQLVYNSARIKW